MSTLFDFVHVARAAVWNLRPRVAAFLAENPTASVPAINAHFVGVSGITGTNFEVECVQQPWEDQEAHFSDLVLIHLIAVYEGWIAGVFEELALPRNRESKAIPNCLQFPSGKCASSGDPTGYAQASTFLKKWESGFQAKVLHPSLARQRRYSLCRIEMLLLAYRYFKEIRNSYIHRAGIADEKAEAAYHSYQAIATSTNLGMRGVPNSPPVVKGRPVPRTIHGSIGLGSIVVQLITTFDAELSRLQAAEKRTLTALAAVGWTRRQLQAAVSKGSVRSLFRAAKLPSVADGSAATTFVARHLRSIARSH